MEDVTFTRGTLRIGRGIGGRDVAVKQIGKGMFSTVYLGTDGRVYAVVKDDGGDNAKEILSNLDERSAYLPAVTHEGDTTTARVYSMPLYRVPLRKGDSATAWKQYTVLKRCWEAGLAAVRSTLKWGEPTLHHGHAIMDAVVECAEADPAMPAGLVNALDLLRSNAANYGSDWTFEFSPRNLGTTEAGHLILLDVVFSQETVQQVRKAKAAAADRAQRRW